MPAPARPRGHAQTCAASRACPCRHPYPGTVNHPCVFSVREERSSPAKVACAPLARHSETTEHCARRRRARCRVQRIHSRVPGNCGTAHSVRLRLDLPSVADPQICVEAEVGGKAMDSAVAQSIDDGLFVRLGETDAEAIWRRDHRTLDRSEEHTSELQSLMRTSY